MKRNYLTRKNHFLKSKTIFIFDRIIAINLALIDANVYHKYKYFVVQNKEVRNPKQFSVLKNYLFTFLFRAVSFPFLVFLLLCTKSYGSFSSPPTSHDLHYISLTSGFTRLSMKTKYVCRGPISLYVNFHSNRTM